MQNSRGLVSPGSASQSGFAQSGTLGSPARTGIKKEVDELYARFQEHEDAVARLDATIEKNAALSDESIKAVQSSMKASISSLRDEMHRKFTSITVELAQLQKAVNVQRYAVATFTARACARTGASPFNATCASRAVGELRNSLLSLYALQGGAEHPGAAAKRHREAC